MTMTMRKVVNAEKSFENIQICVTHKSVKEYFSWWGGYQYLINVTQKV
jgi:hypothetical protein